MSDDTMTTGRGAATDDGEGTARERMHRAGEAAAAAGRRGAETARRAGEAVRPHAERVAAAAGRAGRTVVGQARAALRRTGAEAENGAREVAGQAEAQGEQVAEVASDAVDGVLTEAERAVDDRPAPGVPYEDWTRQQLYERAQELDIEGRASMTKAELIDALRR